MAEKSIELNSNANVHLLSDSGLAFLLSLQNINTHWAVFWMFRIYLQWFSDKVTNRKHYKYCINQCAMPCRFSYSVKHQTRFQTCNSDGQKCFFFLLFNFTFFSFNEKHVELKFELDNIYFHFCLSIKFKTYMFNRYMKKWN